MAKDAWASHCHHRQSLVELGKWEGSQDRNNLISVETKQGDEVNYRLYILGDGGTVDIHHTWLVYPSLNTFLILGLLLHYFLDH